MCHDTAKMAEKVQKESTKFDTRIVVSLNNIFKVNNKIKRSKLLQNSVQSFKFAEGREKRNHTTKLM